MKTKTYTVHTLELQWDTFQTDEKGNLRGVNSDGRETICLKSEHAIQLAQWILKTLT